MVTTSTVNYETVMLTLVKVWMHLNRRHTQNFTSYRPTRSYYRVEKHTEIPDIIYTQMQHLTGGKVLLKMAGEDVRRGKCPTPISDVDVDGYGDRRLFGLFSASWYTQASVGLCGSAVERQSLPSVLSPSCARPVADG